MSEPTTTPSTNPTILDCPCCGEKYEALITVSEEYEDERGDTTYLPGGLVWADTVRRAETPQGEPLEMCSRCHEPCCPRCECIFGEGVLACTRCTRSFTCVHDGRSHPLDSPRASFSAKKEQGNIVVSILIVSVLAIVGLVTSLRWTERKIRESQEQSISKKSLEEFVRFACPSDTEKLLVVSADTTHPAVGPACPAVYLTLAQGDAQPKLRCMRGSSPLTYGTALCVKREQVTMDAFTVAAFKEPPLPTDSTRPKKRR